MIAALLAASMIAAGQPQEAPKEWRRTDMSDDTPAATAFAAEANGVRRATVVIRAPVDRGSARGPFRGVVFQTEVRCEQRMWRITSVTYYSADYAVVSQVGEVPEAPLVRETPLHSAITDICDGGHTGPVGLTSEDPIAVQRWLDGL